MKPKERPPTDYRAARRRDELWLVVAAVVVLVVVGGGLIGLLFGFDKLLTGLPCLVAGAGGIAAIYFFFLALERWSES